jgi:hypothetical protein
MGTLNFSRKLCPFFSIAVPLNSLLKLRAVFKWGEREQTALDTFKTTIAQQDKLYHIDHSIPFRLYTDLTPADHLSRFPLPTNHDATGARLDFDKLGSGSLACSFFTSSALTATPELTRNGRSDRPLQALTALPCPSATLAYRGVRCA